MANNLSTIFSFGADISDLQKKIEQAKKEIASMRAESANTMVSVANEANKQAAIDIKKAEQNLKHAEQKVAEKEHRLQEAMLALGEAERKLESEKKAADLRANDPNYVANSDPNVKASQKAAVEAQKELKKAQNDLVKAQKEEIQAHKKLQKENYKVSSAENAVKKAQADSAAATAKHAQAVKNYTKLLDDANEAKEKLAKGGNIASDTALKRAEVSANRADDRVNQQQRIVDARKDRVEQAKANVDIANQAREQAKKDVQERNNDSSYVAENDKNVKKAQRELAKAQNEKTNAQKEAEKASKIANDASQKVQKEIYKEVQALNALKKARDEVNRATAEASYKANAKEIADKNLNEAKEKLANGGSLVSSNGLEKSKIAESKSNDSLKAQQKAFDEQFNKAIGAENALSDAKAKQRAIAEANKVRVNNKAIIEENDANVKEAQAILKGEEKKVQIARAEHNALKDGLEAANNNLQDATRTAEQRKHWAEASVKQLELSRLNAKEMGERAQEAKAKIDLARDNTEKAELENKYNKAKLKAEKAEAQFRAQSVTTTKSNIAAQKAEKQKIYFQNAQKEAEQRYNNFDKSRLSTAGMQDAQRIFDDVNREAKQKTADKENANAQKAVNNKQKEYEKQTQALDNVQNELARKEKANQLDKQRVIDETARLEKANAVELEKLNKSAQKAAQDSIAAENKKQSALDKTARMEQEAENATNRRKKAESASLEANRNAYEKSNYANGEEVLNKIKSAQSNLENVNKNAIAEQNRKALNSAEASYNSAVDSLKKESAKLDASNTELARKTETANNAQKKVIAETQNLQKANAEQLEKINNQVADSAVKVKKAESQKIATLENERQKENQLADAIKRRDSVQQQAAQAKDVVSQKSDVVNTKQGVADVVGYNLAKVNSNAIDAENQRLINVANQKIVQAADNIKAANRELEKTKTGLEQAAQTVENAKTKASKAKINVDSAEANAKLAGLKAQLVSLGKIHDVPVRSDGIEHILRRLATVTLAFKAIQKIGSTVANIMSRIAGSGYEYAKTMESSRIGIAGIYASLTEIDGQRTTFQQGLGIANDVVNRLQQAATVTAATPTDMIRTFQGLAGPGLGAGMNTDELVQYTKVGVNAAKAMQLPADQFIQELRDMVQGGIQPASSTIATALGLKDSDIKQMKNSADGLFKSLMDKMAGLAEGANMYVDTITGKEEMLKQTFIQTGAVFSSTFETEIKGALDSMIQLMADVNTTTGEFKVNPAIVEFIEQLKSKVLELMDVWGNFDPDTGAFAPNQDALDAWNSVCDFLDKIKNLALDISDMLIAWSPAIAEFCGGLGEAFEWAMSILDSVVNNLTWLGKIVSASDTLKAIIKDIAVILGVQGILHVVGLVFKLTKKLVAVTWLWQTAIKAVNAILAITKVRQKAIMILEAAQLALATAKQAVMKAPLLAFGVAAGGILGGISGAFDGIFNSIKSGLSSLGEKILPDDKDDEGKEKDADYYEKLSEKRLNQLGYNKDKDPYAASKATAMNKDKTDEKEAAKARREQLAANKQALKQQTELIKENQEKQLAALKDTMESIQVAFDDARIGWQQYTSEKAENAVQQQQVKVDAIKAEIEATKNSDAFKTQAELNTALSKLNKTLSKETTTLEKLIASQEDVANVIAFYSKQSTTPYTDAQNKQMWSNVNGPMPESVPLNSFGGDTAQWLMHYYVSHGLSKDIAAALVGNQRYESAGFNPNAISGDGYGSYGLSQFTDDRLNGSSGLINWAKQNGLDASDLRNQAAFTLEELLNRGYLEAIKASMAAGNSATVAVRKAYEGANPNLANDAKRSEYAQEAFDNFQETATVILDSAAKGLEAGLEAGFKAWNGQTMKNGREGCVEAVEKIGSQYSDFLREEFSKTARVPQLQQDAKAAGVPEIPYDESKLKPGDVIVYDNDEHVLIYKGHGRTVGNSSSALDRPGYRGPGMVKEQGIDIGMIPTSIIQTGTYGVAANMQTGPDMYPATKAGMEAKKKAKEARKRAQDITKQYQELYGDVSTIPIEQLIEELSELKKKLINDGHKTEAEEVNVVLAAKKNQLAFKTQANYLKLAMNTVEENASDLVYKIADEMYDASEMAQKYLDYYTKGNNYPVNDPRIKDSKKFDISIILDNYRKQLDKALRASDLKTAWEIEKAIRNIQNSLVGMLDKFVQAVKDKASWRNNMIDANKQLTSGQKDRAKKQVEYNTNKQEAKINRISAQWYYEQAKSIPLNGAGKPSNESEYKRLMALSDLKARQAAYNEELTRTYTLLEQTGFVAKQALEDGLLTFLTDSVNQCQSLEEALSNLAITILKELQKMFAKNIIAELMDTWFPQKGNEGNATTEAYNNTMEISAKIGELAETLAITADNFQIKAVSAAEAYTNAINNTTNGILDAINNGTWSLNGGVAKKNAALETAVSNEPMVENFGKSLSVIDYSNGTVKNNQATISFNSAIQPLNASITAIGTNAQTASPQVDSLGQGLTTLSTNTPQAASQVEVFTTAVQSLTPALESATQVAREMAMAVSSMSMSSGAGGSEIATVKKATGGYISGAGTSTSDSIPAMLSNGEYVVRANAVRKYGRSMLDKLNSGSWGNLRVRIPKFATGGYVGQKGSTAVSEFSSSFGATVSPQLHVNNYVDGKRVFDAYGKDIVRSEVQNSIVKNAKFFAETMRRI